MDKDAIAAIANKVTYSGAGGMPWGVKYPQPPAFFNALAKG